MTDKTIATLERLSALVVLVLIVWMVGRTFELLDELKADIARPVPACPDCQGLPVPKDTGGVR